MRPAQANPNRRRRLGLLARLLAIGGVVAAIGAWTSPALAARLPDASPVAAPAGRPAVFLSPNATPTAPTAAPSAAPATSQPSQQSDPIFRALQASPSHAATSSMSGTSPGLTPTPAPDPAPTAFDPPTGIGSGGIDYSNVPSTTWKVLVLIYRQTDVHYTDSHGHPVHLQATMTDAMHKLLRSTVDRIEPTVRSWSHGLADWKLTVIEADHPLNHLQHWQDGYWAGSIALESDLDRYAPQGRFDSVIVLWQPFDGAGQSVPVPAWGLSIEPGPWANGAGLSSITAPAHMSWLTKAAYPEEIFVHEWMHQVTLFYAQHGGMPAINMDAASSFGYTADRDGSWRSWTVAAMTGHIHAGDRWLGVKARFWQEGTPTEML